jgi:hypothetical protein
VRGWSGENIGSVAGVRGWLHCIAEYYLKEAQFLVYLSLSSEGKFHAEVGNNDLKRKFPLYVSKLV